MASATARLFDAMAEDYETLEPWYEHLYAVLHPLLLDALALTDFEERPGFAGALRASGGLAGPVASPPMSSIPRALDAGCGSGFQTSLLERLGYQSHGVDLAAGLLAVARRRLASSALALGSVEALPYRDESFEAITCCGSTLSFVDDPAGALGELARVLKPGGRLLLEVEHRFSLDLAWTLISALAGDALGYGRSPREAWRQITRGPRERCLVTYPGYGELTLFTRRALCGMLAEAGLGPVRWWGIHSITNLIPSTALHRERLGRLTAALYAWLRTLDARLSRSPFAARIANSLVVLAVKRSPALHLPRPPC